MANTFIGLTNLLETATLKNGTGGAPALNETSPYTMAKLQNSDRYTIWKTATLPPSPLYVDFDLGSDKPVTAAGILGFRPSVSGAANTLKIYSAAEAAGYVPAGWTLQGTVSPLLQLNPRDAGIVFASVSHRYWRFEFGISIAAYSAGKLWLGSPTNLGGIHSPGGSYVPFRNRLETPMPGGAIVLSDLGDPGGEFTLPWNSIQAALRTTFLSLSDVTGSFLLIDHEGLFFEVYLRGGRMPVVRKMATLWDVSPELVRLP